MLFWWMRRRRHGCGEAHAHAGPGGGGAGERFAMGHDEDLGGGAFGVRRPLRFLAWKLELDESQMAELARILGELKTERAQAAVDERRTSAAFADAIASDAFGDAKAGEGATLRLQSAQRLRDAVVKALQKLHAVLNADQRKKLATLLRTGALSI
jgi:Spy/CpxP family protein refolding chaperone